MPVDHTLRGRIERRLPIILEVRLALAELANLENEERTFTDNLSSRGARVFSARSWHLGDVVRVTPQNETSACGKVVYCQSLGDGRFVTGVEFQEHPVTWSMLQRYDGQQSSSPPKSKSS